MKKISSIVCAIAVIFFVNAANAATSDINLKIAGISYPGMSDNSPKKVAYDGSIGFNLGLDKMFAIGVEGGFDWASWDKSSGSNPYGPVALTKTETINSYSLPVLANAIFRYDQRSESGFMPYLTLGAGYDWTFFRMTGANKTFSGFTWQVLAGIAIAMGEGSNIDFLLEAGYRGMKVKDKDSYTLDMSGFVAHIGVRIPFGQE